MTMLNSVRDTAWNQIKQGWITGALVGVVVVAWLQVIAAADWLRDANVMVSAASCGVLYGYLLASTRFRGRTALIIDLVTSLGFALLVVGRVLPEAKLLTAQSFEKTIWLMNARTFTALETLRDDAQWLTTNYFPNTRLFLFLNVFALWNAAAWLMWCVTRRKRALRGVLPIAALIAYHTGLGRDGPSVPLWFIAGSVLLMARTAFTYTVRDWDRRKVGFPDLIGEDWTAVAAILSVVVILLAGVSTPEWRNSMQRFMESLRPSPPPAEKSAAPIVVQVKPTGDYAASFVPSMGYVGDPFPESTETIFYVTTSDAPSGMESNGVAKPPNQQHYWRGAIYDRYTGTGWEQLNVSVAAPQPESIDLVAPGRYALTQQFQIVSLQDNRLFAAGQPVASKDATLQAAPEDATAILPRGRIPQYEITSWTPKVSGQELEADTAAYPPEIATRYLQLPDSVPQRVKDLAARLVQSAASPYDKALRVQAYLRATYLYKLDVPPPPNRDVVDYFLFDAPGGFCSYYASAMTVLLRSQGVPARVVVGFATGNYDGLLRRYVVPANAAHAWVEVYFPTYGWIEFEPTAARLTFEYTGVEAPQPDRLPETSTARSDNAPPTVFVIGAFAVLLISSMGFAAFYLWRRQRLLQLAPEVQARRLYWQTRRSLAQLGVEAAGSATPAEFLRACADRLIDQPRLQDSVCRVTELYIRAVFMSAPPDRSDVDLVRQAWRSTWRERVRLRWRRIRRKS